MGEVAGLSDGSTRLSVMVGVTIPLGGSSDLVVLDDTVNRHRYKGFFGTTLIARSMGPTWGPSGANRTQVGPWWPHELCYLGGCYPGQRQPLDATLCAPKTTRHHILHTKPLPFLNSQISIWWTGLLEVQAWIISRMCGSNVCWNRDWDYVES